MLPKPSSSSRPPSPAVVFVVDDDPSTVEVVSEALLRHGHHPRGFTDPTEALALIESGHIPDAIVLDCVMPAMTGGEFLQRLAEDGVDAPVVIVTALSDPYFMFDPHDPRAPSVISKPFDLSDLIGEVDHLIARSVRFEPKPRSNHPRATAS